MFGFDLSVHDSSLSISYVVRLYNVALLTAIDVPQLTLGQGRKIVPRLQLITEYYRVSADLIVARRM